MIFATLGTHHQPFARFIEALEPVAARTFVQYGHNPAPEGFARAEAFISFEEVIDAMAEAEAVVTHAGVGSILCARDAGHMPIVVPRLHRLGEHVDDHQMDLTTTLSGAGAVEVLGDGESLESLLARLPARSKADARPASALSAAVGDAIENLGEK